MRNRLIELLKKASYGMLVNHEREEIADYLLSQGVIVPPFRIGTVYYRLIKKNGKLSGNFFVIRKATLSYYNIGKVLNDFGRTVFLTKEEALARLQNLTAGGDSP